MTIDCRIMKALIAPTRYIYTMGIMAAQTGITPPTARGIFRCAGGVEVSGCLRNDQVSGMKEEMKMIV